MKALDTNVIVRVLLRDDQTQARRAAALLQEAEEQGSSFLLTDAVVLELIWVLQSVYALTRPEVLDALELLADLPVLKLQSHDAVRRVVSAGRVGSTDLADLFIGLTAAAHGCERTLTFDRRLARSDLFALVP